MEKTNVEIMSYGKDPQKQLNLANWLVRGGMALLVGALAYKGLPYVVSIVENTFQIALGLTKTLMVAIPVGFGLSFLWANRSLLKKIREDWAAKLWKNYIYNDPLQYIEGVINEFETSLVKIQKGIEGLLKVLNKLQDKANEIALALKNGISVAEYLDEQGKTDEANIQAYEVFRGQQTIEGIQQSYLEVEESMRILQELESHLKNDIRVMRIDLSDMRLNLEIAGIKADVADAMMEAMAGNPQELARREYAKWAYRDKVSGMKAKFDGFMAKANPILESKRIEQAITSKDGRKFLEEIRNGKDIGGLKNFSQGIEDLKNQNPELYKGHVNLSELRKRSTQVVRSTHGNGSTGFGFSHLK